MTLPRVSDEERVFFYVRAEPGVTLERMISGMHICYWLREDRVKEALDANMRGGHIELRDGGYFTSRDVNPYAKSPCPLCGVGGGGS